MRLTENFRLEEFIASDTAQKENIDNTPSDEIVINLRSLAVFMEKIRKIADHPLKITSGYRCFDLNKAVGGSENSFHMKGLACDVEIIGVDNQKELIKKISESALFWYQIILYPNNNFMHFSIHDDPAFEKKEILLYSLNKFSKIELPNE